MAVHSLDSCLPETEGDVRPGQYTVWTVVYLRMRVMLGQGRQYTVWTVVCLRLRVMLSHGSTQSGQLSAWDWGWCSAMAVHSLDCCLPETEGDARPWQYTVWTVVYLRLRVMLGHGSTQSGLLSTWDWGWCSAMAVHSLDCCLPETEGDARPWQYTVWTVVYLRMRVMLGHGSTQSGLMSVWDWGWCWAMAVHSLDWCLSETEGDARPWQYTVWTVVYLRLRVMLGHGSTQSGLLSTWEWGWCWAMAGHSLDCCLPETEGDTRPWQYSLDWCLPETEGDARPWQYSLDWCLPETEGDTRPWQYSLDWCLPENEGDARPWQYSLDWCLPETEGDARPWQYTVWTAVCLRLRVMLGHGSTQSGLLSVWDWGWC